MNEQPSTADTVNILSAVIALLAAVFGLVPAFISAQQARKSRLPRERKAAQKARLTDTILIWSIVGLYVVGIILLALSVYRIDETHALMGLAAFWGVFFITLRRYKKATGAPARQETAELVRTAVVVLLVHLVTFDFMLTRLIKLIVSKL